LETSMPTALLSVWDKTGLIELATSLKEAGWELIASGGTARALVEAGFPVKSVADVTGEPEMLGGRVKTLHPAIHAGLLARDTETDRAALAARGWAPIDLVVVNLYPFEAVISEPGTTLDQAIEMIDIGGVALLRAAAKNFTRVTVLSDPEDYRNVPAQASSLDFRRLMATKAFRHTAQYDQAIKAYLGETDTQSEALNLTLHPVQELRYGENPHQKAALYNLDPQGLPLGGEQLQGKPLSYNNLLDLDAAWQAARAFKEPGVAIVKHLSPCGLAIGPDCAAAVPPAIASDPVSAFGSVIAANRVIDEQFVLNLGDLFVECIIAPDFSPDARGLLAAKRNLRLIRLGATPLKDTVEYRSVLGGLLRQTVDFGDPAGDRDWQVVSRRKPDATEWQALSFAWQAVQPVKSNAIVMVRENDGVLATVGIGGGQPNRVDCVHIAGRRAGDKAQGAVLASDAFFPFPDGVLAAAEYGVTAVIQPGGSRGDEAVIAAVDETGLAMVFTGTRHFRH
jgi:phosphoribosylaminoimidazolecarboxamide formyltransferase/IMP cyclohydrolase